MASKGKIRAMKRINAECRLRTALVKARKTDGKNLNSRRINRDLKLTGLAQQLRKEATFRCLVPECRNHSIENGYCLDHQEQAEAARVTRNAPGLAQSCTVPGCNDLAVGDGLCADHQI